MENYFAVFRDHPGPFIVIFLGLLSISFVLLRRRYLLKYMKPRHLSVALFIFIINIYLALSTLSRVFNVVYP